METNRRKFMQTSIQLASIAMLPMPYGELPNPDFLQKEISVLKHFASSRMRLKTAINEMIRNTYVTKDWVKKAAPIAISKGVIVI